VEQLILARADGVLQGVVKHWAELGVARQDGAHVGTAALPKSSAGFPKEPGWTARGKGVSFDAGTVNPKLKFRGSVYAPHSVRSVFPTPAPVGDRVDSS
jgi:hypothetical protein